MASSVLQPEIITQWFEMSQQNIHCFSHFFQFHSIRRISLFYPNTADSYLPHVDIAVKMFVSEISGSDSVSIEYLFTRGSIGFRGITKLSLEDFTGQENVDAVVIPERNIFDGFKDTITQINPTIKVFWLGDIITDIYQVAVVAAPLVATLAELRASGKNVLFVLAPIAEELEKHSQYEEILLQNKIVNGGIGRVLKEVFPYSGLSEKYTIEEYCEIAKSPLTIIPRKNYFVMADYKSISFNISNSIRATIGQPSQYDFRVHVFGNSAGLGAFLADEDTSSSHLQDNFNKNGIKACVTNYCVDAAMSSSISLRIQDTFIEDHDMVVVIQPKSSTAAIHTDFYQDYYVRTMERNGIPVLVSNVHFQRPHKLGEVFLDARHLNPYGNKCLGELIFNALMDAQNEHVSPLTTPCPYFGITEEIPKSITLAENWYDPINENPEFRNYIENLKFIGTEIPQATGVIGAIVVNCNPFTLGHRYLIEKAANEVDFLYVFVVEEDLSVFPFEDRINLVDLGTDDLPNVAVLGSGKFIISSLTFPEYFVKGERQGAVIDPSADVELFGLHIAPALGISIRFAGTEPNDSITRQYNEYMSMLLPKYNIEFREVERIIISGDPISASRVRSLLDDRDFENIKTLVPLTTLEYLQNFIAD